MHSYTPDARKKRLDGICGASDKFEVSRAEAQGLEDPRIPLVVTCEGQILDSGMPGKDQTFEIGLEGAWIEPVHELKEQTRTYPVIFRFAHTDLTEVNVKPPSGYTPKGAPAPIRLEGRFGTYLLSISADETGYHVQRAFTLLPIHVAPENYPELRSFLGDAHQADRSRLAFVKKASQ